MAKYQITFQDPQERALWDTIKRLDTLAEIFGPEAKPELAGESTTVTLPNALTSAQSTKVEQLGYKIQELTA